MASDSHEFRSRLKNVKGLGSAHHGVGHWWLQRVTAIAMIPLSVWFICALVTVLNAQNVIHVAEWFASPVNALLTVLLLTATFFHAKLGMQVVIEDYVKGAFSKYALLLANSFVCFMFAGITILAVLKLHFLDIASSM